MKKKRGRRVFFQKPILTHFREKRKSGTNESEEREKEKRGGKAPKGRHLPIILSFMRCQTLERDHQR